MFIDGIKQAVRFKRNYICVSCQLVKHARPQSSTAALQANRRCVFQCLQFCPWRKPGSTTSTSSTTGTTGSTSPDISDESRQMHPRCYHMLTFMSSLIRVDRSAAEQHTDTCRWRDSLGTPAMNRGQGGGRGEETPVGGGRGQGAYQNAVGYSYLQGVVCWPLQRCCCCCWRCCVCMHACIHACIHDVMYASLKVLSTRVGQ